MSQNRGRDNEERGFAAMDDDKQREIARKGGEAVSKDREHMAEIGKKDGETAPSSFRTKAASVEIVGATGNPTYYGLN